MDFSFEVIAAWDSPGPAGSALGGPHDFQLFYVLNEGGSSEPGAFGSACIMPAGEITIPHSWDANYPLVYNFRATVPPTTASF